MGKYPFFTSIPIPPGVPYLLWASSPGAAGPPGSQEPALLSMGEMFAQLGLVAKAHFSRDNQKTSAKKKKKKKEEVRAVFQQGAGAGLKINRMDRLFC